MPVALSEWRVRIGTFVHWIREYEVQERRERLLKERIRRLKVLCERLKAKQDDSGEGSQNDKSRQNGPNPKGCPHHIANIQSSGNSSDIKDLLTSCDQCIQDLLTASDSHIKEILAPSETCIKHLLTPTDSNIRHLLSLTNSCRKDQHTACDSHVKDLTIFTSNYSHIRELIIHSDSCFRERHVAADAGKDDMLSDSDVKDLLTPRDSAINEILQPKDYCINRLLTPKDSYTCESPTPRDSCIQELLTARDSCIQELLTARDSCIQELLTARDSYIRELLSVNSHIQEIVTPRDSCKSESLTTGGSTTNVLLTIQDSYIQGLLTTGDFYTCESLSPRDSCIQESSVNSHTDESLSPGDGYIQEMITPRDSYTSESLTTGDSYIQELLTPRDSYIQELLTQRDNSYTYESLTPEDSYTIELVPPGYFYNNKSLRPRGSSIKELFAPRDSSIRALLTPTDSHTSEILTPTDSNTKITFTPEDCYTKESLTQGDSVNPDFLTPRDSYIREVLTPRDSYTIEPLTHGDSYTQDFRTPTCRYSDIRELLTPRDLYTNESLSQGHSFTNTSLTPGDSYIQELLAPRDSYTNNILMPTDSYAYEPHTPGDPYIQELLAPRESYTKKLLTPTDFYANEPLTPEDSYIQELITPRDLYTNESLTPGDSYIHELLALKDSYTNESLTLGHFFTNTSLTPGDSYIQKLLAPRESYTKKLLTPTNSYANEPLTHGDSYTQDFLTPTCRYSDIRELLTPRDSYTNESLTPGHSFTNTSLTPGDSYIHKLLAPRDSNTNEAITPGDPCTQDFLTPGYSDIREILTTVYSSTNESLTRGDSYIQDFLTPRESYIQELLTPRDLNTNESLTPGDSYIQELLTPINSYTNEPLTGHSYTNKPFTGVELESPRQGDNKTSPTSSLDSDAVQHGSFGGKEMANTSSRSSCHKTDSSKGTVDVMLSQQPYLTELLLVKAGDVELNPGPLHGSIDSVLQESELESLAKEVPGNCYNNLCIGLGFSLSQSQEVLTQHHLNLTGALIEFFCGWKVKQRDGTNCRALLGEILQNADMSALQTKLLKGEYLTSGTSPFDQILNTSQPDMTEAQVLQCGEDLKTFYIEEMCKIKPDPLDFNIILKFQQIYTNLTLLRKEMGTTRTKKPLDYTDLLTTKINGVLPKRLLVEGEGGVGKTTFCSKIAWDWVNGSPEFQRFSWVLVIPLRNVVKGQTIGDIIKTYLSDYNAVNPKQIDNYILSQPTKVLIVLDGLDEYDGDLSAKESSDISRILRLEKFKQCIVLVTTRPWKADEIKSNEELSRSYAFIEVQGFSDENVSTYISRYFMNDGKAGSELIRFIEMNDLIRENMAPFPIYVAMLCILWENCDREKKEPIRRLKTFSQLFHQLIMFLGDHYVSKVPKVLHEAHLDKEMENIKLCLQRIGLIAFSGLLKKKFVFNEEDFSSCEEAMETCCRMGFLSRENFKVPRWKRTLTASQPITTCVFFPQKLFQEYIASVYLASLYDTNREEYSRLMGKVLSKDPQEFRYLLYFTAAMGEEVGLDIVKKIQLNDFPNVQQRRRNTDFVADVTFEAYNKGTAKAVGQQIFADRRTLTIDEYMPDHTISGYLFIMEQHGMETLVFRDRSCGPTVSRDLADVLFTSNSLSRLVFYRTTLDDDFYQLMHTQVSTMAAGKSSIKELAVDHQFLNDLQRFDNGDINVTIDNLFPSLKQLTFTTLHHTVSPGVVERLAHSSLAELSIEHVSLAVLRMTNWTPWLNK